MLSFARDRQYVTLIHQTGCIVYFVSRIYFYPQMAQRSRSPDRCVDKRWYLTFLSKVPRAVAN